MLVGTVPAAPARAHWWRYVDERRTHEVVAEWREREGLLRVLESVPGAPEPAVVDATHVGRSWEAHVGIWTLESRLSLLGRYWRMRSVDAGWSRVRRPPGAITPDLRASDVLGARSGVVLHHYHDDGQRLDRVVAALRGRSARYAVVRAELELPSFDVGRVALLNAGLPEPIMRSVLAREQLALATHGLSKLVSREDYQRAFGDDGPRRVERVVDEVVDRAAAGQWEKPAPVASGGPDALEEFMAMLNDPRLTALHTRFLEFGEEEQLLAGGPASIKRAISLKRVHAEHSSQHLLTILEASLLARERVQSGRLTRYDPEVRALTRLAYYL